MSADPLTAQQPDRPPGDRPRVVMVVNNGMATDARVVKSAQTLVRAGADVRVLGVASPGTARAECVAGGAAFVRLPTLPARGATPAYVLWALRRRAGHLFPIENWRAALAVSQYYRAAFLPEIIRLAPDVLHAHDVHLLGVVVEAARRLERAGRPRPVVIYDSHEYVADLAVSGARTQRAADGWRALEAELITSADRVITVAPRIAERLGAEHRLATPVSVVYNAPLAFEVHSAQRDLRAEAGVGPQTPLVVYSGALSAQRGLNTVVEAMPSLAPDVHLAIVAVPFPHPLATEITALAARLGVADRVHIVPPVAPHEVPAYLSTANVGVSPILGTSASYDMALPNKLFEFVHAGLTLAVSDTAGMSAFVREHDLGEVFSQGDAASCAVAVTRALARPRLEPAATAALRREFSWQSQEAALVAVYRSLAGRVPALDALHASDAAWTADELTLDFAPAR